MLLKFIILSIIALFVIIRVGSFIYRTLFWMLGARTGERNMYKQYGQRPQQPRQAGDVFIDYVPENDTKKKGASYGGGEYVDYEEVK